MDKMVRTVFGTIMLSIILFVLSDTVTYFMRVNSLNYRMNAVVNTLYTTCSRYNYIPDEVAEAMGGVGISSVPTTTARTTGNITGGILGQIRNSFNTIHQAGVTEGYRSSDFVQAMNLNYGNKGSVNDDLSTSRKFGDVRTVELQVMIRVPVWGIDFTGDSTRGIGQTTELQRRYNTRILTYTASVPCLKYTK